MLWGKETWWDCWIFALNMAGDDTLEATIPVDSRTKQPFGLLHGGHPWYWPKVSGSVAGYLCTEGEQRWLVWKSMLTTSARHEKGGVRGVCKPLHLGSRHQVWQIEIFDEKGRLCCSSRLTAAIF